MPTLLEIFCGVVIVLLALYYYFTATYNFWKNRGVPGPEPIPAFGNTLELLFGKESLPEFLIKIRNWYMNEPMVGLFLRRKPLLFIQDPKLIKDVLIKDFSKFVDRGFITPDPANPLSHHLFALEAKRWRPLRTQLSPVFTSGKLKGTFSLILECSNHLDKYLSGLVAKGEPIEVREIAAKFTTDVIGSCAFGIEMNSLSEGESEFRRIGKKIFATDFISILRNRMQQIIPRLNTLINYILPHNETTKLITKIVAETLEYREKNNIVRPDFMNILLELKKHPEKLGDVELTDDLLAAQAFIFFAAGFETSSTTISNALYELAINQTVQDKLRDEIRQFEAENIGEWKYESIKQMEYLDKVFQETLRKYPPLPILSRESTDNYTFEDTKVTIPKGTLIWVPAYSIQRDSRIYPDPEKFDPERFSEDVEKTRHPMHSLPFGHGPRNCIGARFAVYQTKIGLIKILRSYKVDVCEKTQVPYEYNTFSFILTPISGLYLNMTKVQD